MESNPYQPPSSPGITTQEDWLSRTIRYLFIAGGLLSAPLIILLGVCGLVFKNDYDDSTMEMLLAILYALRVGQVTSIIGLVLIVTATLTLLILEIKRVRHASRH